MLQFALYCCLGIMTAGATVTGQKQKSQPCEKAQTQAEMNICWGNEYKKADAQLNKTYQELAALLEDEDKTELKTAENAWIKYRDAHCAFVADQYRGGTMRPMIEAICLADVTTSRTTELKNQINDRNH